MPDKTYELSLLLQRVKKSQALVEKVQRFYDERHQEWPGVAPYIKDFLERKRDQIDYELHRIEKMGWDIALDMDNRRVDI